MKRNIFFPLLAAGLMLTGCQDKDIHIAEPILAPMLADEITGHADGYDYEWTWTPVQGQEVQVTVLRDGQMFMTGSSADGHFIQQNLEANVPYTYIFKLTDGTNFSTGVIKSYTRPGANAVSSLSLSQVESASGGYDLVASWTPSDNASEIRFSAVAADRKVEQTVAGDASSYTIHDVVDGQEWEVTVTASNAEGIALPVSSSLKIGKTAVGFLSVYPTENDLIANGDDDEASAWLWLKSEYPNARYVYFGDIDSASVIESFRVLFWMRDLEDCPEEDVLNMPEVVKAATPYVRAWYAAGGNLLLWSHAMPYVEALGRIPEGFIASNDHSIGTGVGGWNPDTWSMAVELNPGGAFKKDASTHPIFNGMEVTVTDRTKLIAFKGPGWTEDHNCLFFNLPSILTGLGNQDEACYDMLTETYGIYPLGTWDSQIDWVSQLNVWEARQGNTEFQGTILCIGNGGCEFSMKNEDGTPDISAHPKNNSCQDNILRLAKNSIEYLKSR
jgi:hypothetical protein